MKTYLRIAQLYLEDSDAVEAETYVNRASLLQAECKSEQLLILYKVKSCFLSNAGLSSLWLEIFWGSKLSRLEFLPICFQGDS